MADKAGKGKVKNNGNGQSEESKYLLIVTKNGIAKKTATEDFDNIRRSGLIAITLKKGDALRKVAKTSGNDEIIVVTKKGQSVRFKEKDLRPMGRPAAGNKAILYGDYNYYWLADREGRSLQRLNELYAAAGQIGFNITQRVDGRLILSEAIKCLRMKAA